MWTKESIIEASMPIIALAGTAKSLALEALRKSKTGDKEGALDLIKEAKDTLKEAHHFHHELIIAESEDDDNVVIESNLILMHAEDQFMSAETIIALVTELI